MCLPHAPLSQAPLTMGGRPRLPLSVRPLLRRCRLKNDKVSLVRLCRQILVSPLPFFFSLSLSLSFSNSPFRQMSVFISLDGGIDTPPSCFLLLLLFFFLQSQSQEGREDPLFCVLPLPSPLRSIHFDASYSANVSHLTNQPHATSSLVSRRAFFFFQGIVFPSFLLSASS